MKKNKLDIGSIRNKDACKLSDNELLECIVYYGCRGSSSVERMSEIVCNHFSTVRSLLTASSSFLKALELPSTLVEYIALLREYAIRSSAVRQKTLFSHDTIAEFAKMMLLRIGHLTTEVILGMLFTKDKRFLCVENMALGSVNTAVFDTHTVIESIERYGASYVLLAHNHPSGNCLPSVEDQKTTSHIVHSCKECGYQVLDHYIVTSKAVYSMFMEQYCIVL